MEIVNLQFRKIHLFSALIVSLFFGGFIFGIVVCVFYLFQHGTFDGTIFILPFLAPFISLFLSPYIAVTFFPILLILRYYNRVNIVNLTISGTLVGLLFSLLIAQGEPWQPFFNINSIPYIFAGFFGGLACFYNLKKHAMFDSLKYPKA